MKKRDLNLITDRITSSDEPMQFEVDQMSLEEFNQAFDDFMDSFLGLSKKHIDTFYQDIQIG